MSVPRRPAAIHLAEGGIPTTAADVLETLDRLAAGVVTREGAVAWALSRTGGAGATSPFGRWPRDPVAHMALRALLGSTVDDATRQANGPPYFIRDVDLATWAAALRGEDAPPSPAGVRGRRPHQYRPVGRLAATIRIGPDAAGERLGLEHLRGADDLDYFQELCFEWPRDSQVVLSWRPIKTPDEADVLLERRGREWEPPLPELLDLLGLAPDAVTWRAEDE